METQPTGIDRESQHDEHARHERKMYLRFAAMIATSTTVMFALMYSNVFAVDHVRFSEERLYMALLMGAVMALVMLAFMWGMMYRNTPVNIAILVTALVVGGTALYLSRSQMLVQDEAYMKAMIPHHSIAILTSERAEIDDVRVRRLADEIIRAQRREIAEMEWLISDIEQNGVADSAEEADARPVPSFEAEALSRSARDPVARAIGLASLGLLPSALLEHEAAVRTGGQVPVP